MWFYLGMHNFLELCQLHINLSIKLAWQPVHQICHNDLSVGHRRQGSAANDSVREEVADVESDLYINVLSALLRLMQVRALAICVLETST